MAEEVRIKDLSQIEREWLRHIHNRRARMLPDEVKARLEKLGLIHSGPQGLSISQTGRKLL
jgi:ribosomal protein S19E (S16A)